jgi:hypothetical protein
MISRKTLVVSIGSAVFTLLSRQAVRAGDDPVIVEPKLPPAPFGIAPPGSTFAFRGSGPGVDRETVYVTGVSRDPVANYTINGVEHSGFVVSAARPETVSVTEQRKISKIWPLEVGKTITYERRDDIGGGISRRAWTDEVSVIGTRTLNLGEIKIDVYLVRHRSESASMMGAWESYDVIGHSKFTRIIWFAPSLGWFVAEQRNSTWTSRDNQSSQLQLLNWQLRRYPRPTPAAETSPLPSPPP